MQRQALPRPDKRRPIVFASAIVVLMACSNATDGFAQRHGGGGLSPEERAFMETLGQQEWQDLRSMGRRERHAFIRKLMAEKPQRPAEPEIASPSNGGEKSNADAAPSPEALDGFVPPSEISDDVRMMIGKNRRRNAAEAVAIQKARGGTETGLSPQFIGDGACPEIDSESWAIDYSHKRPWPAIHKGVDIPQPSGTPIRAVADGTVVGRFANDGNRKGIEVMLRHTPEQTGLPFWTYSQYTHLLEMSPLPVGAKVKKGQEIGKTSNSGKMGRRIRRDALHFAILYSRRPEWTNDGRFVAPKDGYWMDPNAFYRDAPPYDSRSLAALPEEQKKVPVAFMKRDGSFVRPEAKRIWPYTCP